MSAPAPADHTAIIAGSILGIVYGAASVTAIVFLLIPRLLAGRAAVGAARPVTRVSRRVVRVARPRPQGLRWSPAYGGGLARTRTGAYVPREEFEMGHMTRVPAANSRFARVNQVLLNLLHFVLSQSHVKPAERTKKERSGALEIEKVISSLSKCTYFGIKFRGRCRKKSFFFKFYAEICALWKAEDCLVTFYNNVIIIIIIS